MTKKRYGLIKNRHKMNVDDYIIINHIETKLLKEKNINLLKTKIITEIKLFLIRNKFKSKNIHIYLTGLSRVQHIVISYLNKIGYNIKIWDFSITENKYIYVTSYPKRNKK